MKKCQLTGDKQMETAGVHFCAGCTKNKQDILLSERTLIFFYLFVIVGKIKKELKTN